MAPEHPTDEHDRPVEPPSSAHETPSADPAPAAEEPRSDPAPAAEEPKGKPPAELDDPWRPTPIVGPRAAYGLAFATGILYFLGYPGLDLWPFSLVALAPLIVAMRGQGPRRSTALGWVAGFTMTMVGFYWLLDMLKVFSGFPTALCALFMALLCAYQAGRIALCGFLYGRVEARGWPAQLTFLAAFATSELLYPLLFPWYFAACVHNAPVLMQTADLGGPLLVGLVLATPSVAVAELLGKLIARRPVSRAWLVAGAAVPIAASLYGLWRIPAVEARAEQSEAAKVGIVQGNQPLVGRHDSLATHQRLTAELKKEGVDLVVWSEAAVMGMFPEHDHQKLIKRVMTGRLGIPTIVGTVLNRPVAEAGAAGSPPPTGRPGALRFFNVALMTDAKGNVLNRYDKQFLLMFGEYLPFGETFPKLYEWSPHSGRFTPGTSYAPLELDGKRYAVTICYEGIIPRFVHRLVREGDPHLLVNMTNDAWFGDTTEPWIHLALQKLRAVEHRRYLVRATNSGVSAVVDPIGRVLAHSSTFKEETLTAVIRYMNGRTVYGVLGDWPFWLLGALTAVGCVVRRPRGRARPASSDSKSPPLSP